MNYQIYTWRLGGDGVTAGDEFADLDEAIRVADAAFTSDVEHGRRTFAYAVQGTGGNHRLRYWQRTRYVTMEDGNSMAKGGSRYSLPGSSPSVRGLDTNKGLFGKKGSTDESK